MTPFYEGVNVDVQAEAIKLVRLFEREAPDEDLVIGMCIEASKVLQYRCDVAQQRLHAAQTARTLDNRRELLKAKVKGVKEAPWPPVAPDAPRVQLVPPGAMPPAIPSKVK